ncbi:MAG: hypothetical protein KDB14_30405 [Planctomycetales bacterium]|nr:hypothetical protein [Planctomycetales bacterium]
MRRIGELLSRHSGEVAWIFGKGPSLDQFSMDDAGRLRICINESLCVVPEPTYFFAHDEPPIRNVAHQWHSGCFAVLQQPRALFAVGCQIPEDQIYVYEKRHADNRVRDMNAAQIAECGALYGNSGTVHSAIHFCRLIGAVKVVLVGFDGCGGYAKSLNMPPGGAAHDRIRQDTVSLLKTMGLDYEFS